MLPLHKFISIWLKLRLQNEILLVLGTLFMLKLMLQILLTSNENSMSNIVYPQQLLKRKRYQKAKPAGDIAKKQSPKQQAKKTS